MASAVSRTTCCSGPSDPGGGASGLPGAGALDGPEGWATCAGGGGAGGRCGGKIFHHTKRIAMLMASAKPSRLSITPPALLPNVFRLDEIWDPRGRDPSRRAQRDDSVATATPPGP